MVAGRGAKNEQQEQQEQLASQSSDPWRSEQGQCDPEEWLVERDAVT